ncbi:MAG TPA: TetR/AcrR family transcriptional regulator [Thermoanaerobaculia bacterium]
MSPFSERLDARPAKQERSRKTLERLLDAAEAVFGERGADGATVPAIARRSGLSVGVVYRRFPDKDALLRGVYERFFARSREANRAALDPARWRDRTAAQILHAVVPGMVTGYRQNRRLLGSLLLYAERHPDPGFRRRADRLSREAFDGIAALLLARRGEIRHPDPEKAIPLVLLAVGSLLRTLAWSERARPFAASDKLPEELTRLCLRYLDVSPDGSVGGPPA